MEQAKKIGKLLLYPHLLVIALLSVGSAAGLVWAFATGREDHWLAYLVYVLSFYALAVWCIRVIPWMARRIRKKKQARDNLTAAEKRKKFRQSLYSGMAVNLAFAAFNLVMGYFRESTWMGSNGLYHLVLTIIHLVLVTYDARLEDADDERKRLRLGWGGFRFCGVLLLILHLTMTGMVFQLIWRGETEEYPGLLIFAVAAYTFYKMTIAIIRVVRFRKNSTPILGASYNIDLSEAMVSMLSLQSGLLTAFGEGDAEFAFLMNSMTGGAVCSAAMLGAIGMVVHGNKKKKELLGEMENGA